MPAPTSLPRELRFSRLPGHSFVSQWVAAAASSILMLSALFACRGLRVTANITFTGDEFFSRDVTELWSRASDLAFLSRAVPDLERVERIDSRQLVCRVRPGFSFLSRSLKLTFDVVEQRPTKRLRLRVYGKGIGTSVAVDIEIDLSEEESGTKLAWKGEVVRREGLLKPVSPSLIDAAAGKVIADVWARFRQAIEQEDPR